MAHNQHLDAEAASRPSESLALEPVDADPLAGEPVFVYGTLKRGHRNHHWLAGASFLGERQLGGAQLFDLGPFPMAVAGAGASATPAASAAAAGEATAEGEAGNTTAGIHGELYRVSAKGLAQLDLLEGCPRLYGRHWLQLLDGSHAWVYLGRPRQVRHAQLLADGLWRLH
ncbi:gamma-glutamylcyclotransferase [Vulcanococcus limneticus Candia 3F8]|uniref:gamma-glutamylcyclotransferase family protein n=1 Tax=Vulcanococcus limneticus TaxID=2170428 RepID=UPI000B97F7B8|nr:gamma-glutamylcyclotransferase family protein [Vulcanococcus limneticus]MCP9791843.1 gamma-glutamylcyclotransferase [Vulcanococcus limneticus MW73D5]MCP9894393.1 gamma-glutamylcyclotransferase [Vulcanococcus limneticus Candia 3F8]MCP9897299.1 gamma-glutamylcyclotransferase [Vulcanococcus limneticus Candia 3B3]